MRIIGIVTLHLLVRRSRETGNLVLGGFDPSMGHASSLRLVGRGELLSVDGDGRGDLIVAEWFHPAGLVAAAAGDTIVSQTLNSTIAGRVVDWRIEHLDAARMVSPSTSSEEWMVDLVVQGVGEGSSGSLTGGISCHATWTWKDVHEVRGRFGTHPSLEAYDAAKWAHRARFYTTTEDGVVHWSGLATSVADRLNTTLPEAMVDLPEMCRPDQSVVIPHLGRRVSPAQFADMAEGWAEELERKARLERLSRITGGIPPGVKDVRFHERRGARLTWELITV